MSELMKGLKIKPIYDDEPAVKLPGKESKFISRIKKTGIKAVDMVQMAIMFHQVHRVSLRSIALKPFLYLQFEEFFKALWMISFKVEMPEGHRMVWYDVDIVKGSAKQVEPMYFESYRNGDKNDEEFSALIRPDFNKPWKA